jgi:hypothetical protein
MVFSHSALLCLVFSVAGEVHCNMYIIITYFVNPSERRETPLMITDSSQVRLAKMAGEEFRKGSSRKRVADFTTSQQE